MCCLTPIEFRINAYLHSDRKSANSLIKSEWCPGGLYTVASTNITGDLSLTFVSLDNVIGGTFISNELYWKPDL